ncbi:MAG: ATP-binding protein [Prolixibacteraceae bacterium]
MEFFDKIKGDEIFRDLFEHSTVGMSITSLDDRLHPNAAFCEMLGYTKQELAEKKWAGFTHPDDVAYNNSVITKILAGEAKSYRWEKRYIHKNGTIVWVDIHTFLHRDATGHPLHFITTVNNITKTKDFEEEVSCQNEQLQQSNAEKDKFFAILAHDLRSPMSSFLGLSEVMAHDINAMTMSEIEDISKSMFVSASNLYQLLENLLEWSILRRGNSEYISEPTSLNKLILRSVEPFMESARRKMIELKVELNDEYKVICDSRMSETIFRNLISNALKYSNIKGSVTLSANPISREEIEITVKDSGIGMNSEIFRKLFKLNEQVCRKGTDGEASSGLGLLICKELVERQGGTIWAESSENEGSSFHFTLKLMGG